MHYQLPSSERVAGRAPWIIFRKNALNSNAVIFKVANPNIDRVSNKFH
jgi:hypothetical protein